VSSIGQCELPDPLVLMSYGDMRFTDSTEVHASNPALGSKVLGIDLDRFEITLRP
jgi:hypothetical protein